MTSNDPTITALEQQVACYERLAKLAAVQHEYVQQNQTERLLDVLRGRQEVLDQIGRFEREIAPRKRAWGTYLATLPPAQRDRAEALMNESRRLLEEITAADRDDALVLQQRKLNLGRQINQAAAARQVNKSYAAAAYGARPARTDVQR